jgi:hypothetical protein
VKYVVVGRLTQEAKAEFRIMVPRHQTPVESVEEARRLCEDAKAQPLLTVAPEGGTVQIGMMYEDAWIVDGWGNRVASPENRVTSPEKRVD